MEPSVIRRILPYLEIESNDCIEYPTRDDSGYGSIQVVSSEGKKLHYRAHRVAYSLTHNISLTPDNVIMHSCDNPACVNVKHLSLGTHKDNAVDKVNKGRQARGKNNGRYKHGQFTKEAIAKRKSIPRVTHRAPNRVLSDQLVSIIKTELRLGMKVRDLSLRYLIKRTLISDIKRGKSYPNVLPLI